MSQANRVPLASLDNAFARAHRAKQHLARLKREITIWRRSVDIPKVDEETGGRFVVSFRHEPTPMKFRILVGEVIYNLRAALDYLVYELAILDDGRVHTGTQFLIEDHEKTWLDHQWRVEGISSEHRAAIKEFQPFRGCHWTLALRVISNADKHRSLITVPTPGIVTFHDAKGPNNVRATVSVEVLFWNRQPVVETLQLLVTEVASTLDSFQPDFEKQDPQIGRITIRKIDARS